LLLQLLLLLAREIHRDDVLRAEGKAAGGAGLLLGLELLKDFVAEETSARPERGEVVKSVEFDLGERADELL